EGDVVQARHALGLRSGAFRARQLARDVVVMVAGGEEDDAPALARAGLGEPEDVAVETSRRLEVADEEGDVTELADLATGVHCVPYAEAATIVLVCTLTASLIQPVFGYLSDQIARRWILPASVFLAGAGLALTGIAPGYLAVLGLVLVMGLGVAAWHPEGYKAATGMAGDRKATALSWFSLGGNVGMALGPPVITSLVTGFSLAGTLGMLVPTVIVGGLL